MPLPVPCPIELPAPVWLTAVPTTGTTVTMVDYFPDIVLWINPAATLAALTVQIPFDASTRVPSSNGQAGHSITIKSSQIITALTIQAQPGDVSTEFYNLPTTIAAGGTICLQKQGTGVWC